MMEKVEGLDWKYVYSKVVGFTILLLAWMTFGAPLVYGLLVSEYVVALRMRVESNPVSMVGMVGGVVAGVWLAKFIWYEVVGIGQCGTRKLATSPATANAEAVASR